MGGPVVITHGTDEQKKRYLPPLLSAEEIWCQGFSEPNAGSDLSGLQTRAEDRGDHYLVNGQKVWTSLAHVAKWCMLVTRERKEANPREGLTYLLVDMESPGVEVRPLHQITGDPEFNEVFFHDVKVPKSQIIGQPGHGWEVAITTLMHERGTLGLALATSWARWDRSRTAAAGSTRSCARAATPSRPGPRRSCATSWPSGCSACPAPASTAAGSASSAGACRRSAPHRPVAGAGGPREQPPPTRAVRVRRLPATPRSAPARACAARGPWCRRGRPAAPEPLP